MKELICTFDGSIVCISDDEAKNNLNRVKFLELLVNLYRERRFYQRGPSVLQHCVVMKEMAVALGYNKLVQEFALTHDLAEAITKDIPSPVKSLMGADCESTEEWIAEKICIAYGIDMPHRYKGSDAYEKWKDLDKVIAVFEARSFECKDMSNKILLELCLKTGMSETYIKEAEIAYNNVIRKMKENTLSHSDDWYVYVDTYSKFFQELTLI